MDIYRVSRTFPPEERFGVTAQVRRAAVSTALNIVEGCARDKEGEYVNFLNIGFGSAAEAHYLLDLCSRLGYLSPRECAGMGDTSDELVRSLQKLVASYRRDARGRDHG